MGKWQADKKKIGEMTGRQKKIGEMGADKKIR